MPTPINATNWKTLTRVVNEIKAPASFIRNLLFGRHETVATEDIQFDELTGGRVVAPFVRKNAEAVLAEGLGRQSRVVQPANIRLKRPFTPSELLFGRQPGSQVFIGGEADVQRAVNAHIARDLRYVNDQVVNAEEYLASQALQGAISISDPDNESFKVTFPRSASHNITLTTFWDAATPETHQNILTVKRLFSEEGLRATDCALGSEAVDQFYANIEAGKIKLSRENNAAITAGAVSLIEQFQDNGAIFLGTVGGIRFWGYERAMTLNGASVDLVRPKYAEWFDADNSASDRVLYYGAIPDMEAFQGRVHVAERFSKSWMTKDPSALMFLIHSRPLPVPRRADATVSMKVISG